ncbi:MAG: hypothetical protein KGO82_20135, partial [Bacteroidota bacterium]|nr:hypothetical protein [Bacteroidota bacterium]
MPVAESIQPLLMAAYRIPSVTGYNRLEPSQRTKNFDRSLKAEIRDSLWMLTRQWQFGEFEGDDSGSPVTAQIYGQHTKVDRITLGGKTFPYDETTPMETMVERMPLRRSLFLSVQLGRYLYKCIAASGGLGDTQKNKLVTQYPLLYSENNAVPLLNIHSNDAEGIQLLNAVTGKLPDGWTLLEAVNNQIGTSTEFAQWLAGAGFTTAEQD